ncbi:putative U-box domain-containing protein 50 [Malus sylvestris]|uniref:putative U-box domain-containing protein 50 n=1 Tax=Malus sylvestris TaxID=3752 RepID=UPI0021AC3F9D|nr:putative U-box domain-containing protein 50 [Malus sylvestris]
MEARREKVYVALGNELQDGFKTLEWTLRRWKSQSISIVILHVTYSISGKDYVYNPFGKLPAASVSDEKLKILRRYEQEKIDKILSKYIAFCGNVKTEILKVEKYDESSHKLILDLISGLHITKLVVGFSFIKSSSWRPKIAISVAFYIHEHKAESCELFIICGGKEVFLRGENDQIIMEDGKGVMVAKMKDEVSIKFLIEKMFLENRHSSLASPTKKDSINLQNLWENFAQEIEVYYQQLCSNLDAEDYELGNGTGTSQLPSPTEAIMMQMNGNPNMSLPEKYESLRTKISETQARMRLKKKEAKENANRHAKAERAICLCERRAQELDVHVKEEGDNRRELKKELDTQKEQLHAEVKDIQESRNKIRSLIELQSELSHKLHISKMAKSQAKVQLENEVMKRVDMVRDIEVLRRERDVFRRRIEFCRQKDATETTEGLSELSCCLREYTDEEIKLATDKFSERFRLKSGIDLTSVYKGRINHVTVAIKVLNSYYGLSQEDFQAKVKLISDIRHPHLLAMMGYCSQPNSTVFEYMHNGSLRDILVSSHEIKNLARDLWWHDHIRIAAEICSAVCYLHMARPKPIVHGHLSPSNILLDCNLVVKVSGLGLNQSLNDEGHIVWDIRAFGILTLNLLTGRNWVDEDMLMDKEGLVRVLDKKAGQWPLDLAEELVSLVLRCLTITNGPNRDLRRIMEELGEIRKRADVLVARGGSGLNIKGIVHGEVTNDVPSVFICPIFQEVMKDPHIAANGFSYEQEAIGKWLRLGHDTSPMTNLKFENKILIPNHTLRSLAQDWHYKRSIPYP